MNITIENNRISGLLRAVEYAPLVHRYLISQVLSPGHEPPELYNYSDQIMTTLNCLGELEQETTDDGRPKTICRLNCRDSKETCELILPVAAALGKNCEFLLDTPFPEDGIIELFKTLKVHGIRHEFVTDRKIRMWGRLTAGTYIIPSSMSSGFLSGLLFALPLLKENSVVMINGPLTDVARTVMSLKVLQESGIYVDAQINEEPEDWSERRKDNFIGATFKIPGNQVYQMLQLPEIEGDWSLAANFLAAGAICGGPVTVSGLNVNTLQKSKQILHILKEAGALVEYGNEMTEEARRGLFRSLKSRTIGEIEYSEEEKEASYIRVTGFLSDPTDLGRFFQREHLHAFEVNLRDVPELLPAAALLATAANGISCLQGMDYSDPVQARRIALLIQELEKQGIMLWETEGSLYIEGYSGTQPLSGGVAACRGDERIAMMEGVASSISAMPVMIEGAEAVNKSYPEFFTDLKRLQSQE